jgi:hypothetical protein
MAGKSALLLLLLQRQLSNGTIASTYCENKEARDRGYQRQKILPRTLGVLLSSESFKALDFNFTATKELVISFVAQATKNDTRQP